MLTFSVMLAILVLLMMALISAGRGTGKAKIYLLFVAIGFTTLYFNVDQPDDGPSTPTNQDQQSFIVQIDPNVAYVKKLNDMDIKDDLDTIINYGDNITNTDFTNENDVKSLKKFYGLNILKYTNIVNDLEKMNAPTEYKDFHKLLTDTASNFLESMIDMDQHLQNPNETDYLKKSTDYYKKTADSMIQLSKKLPYGDLK